LRFSPTGVSSTTVTTVRELAFDRERVGRFVVADVCPLEFKSQVHSTKTVAVWVRKLSYIVL
jgi:hypothetical protein